MTNICGCLVHTRPERVAAVIQALQAFEGGEVHGHEGGRIVLTVEDTPDKRASDQIMDMHQIPGVLTITLTYHHFEDIDETAAAVSVPHH